MSFGWWVLTRKPSHCWSFWRSSLLGLFGGELVLELLLVGLRFLAARRLCVQLRAEVVQNLRGHAVKQGRPRCRGWSCVCVGLGLRGLRGGAALALLLGALAVVVAAVLANDVGGLAADLVLAHSTAHGSVN